MPVLSWRSVLAENRVPFIERGANVKRGEINILRRRPTHSAVWKPVPGFEGLYEVCDEGFIRALARVRQHGGYRPRTLRERVLSTKCPCGRYVTHSLWRDGAQAAVTVSLHVVVATVFVPNPQGLPLVRHLDDNRRNNRAANLAWGSRADNAADAVKNGRVQPRKLSDDQVRQIRALCISEAHRLRKRSGGGLDLWLAEMFGVSPTLISDIRRGKVRRHVTDT